jgi:hypothetical protein
MREGVSYSERVKDHKHLYSSSSGTLLPQVSLRHSLGRAGAPKCLSLVVMRSGNSVQQAVKQQSLEVLCAYHFLFGAKHIKPLQAF